ncbi:MAG: signal recognition particle protein, partial [Planctomycetota bacterium]
REVTGAPILFTGVGEKLDALEEFHAERIASRILGMGDVVSLVEKAQQEVSEEEAEAMAEKMAPGELSMGDFLKQLRSLRRMGPMKQIMGLLPGVGQMLKNVEVDEKQLDRLEGMVNSMTPSERDDVETINPSRKRRIAGGSGVKPEDVSGLVKQFRMVSQMTKQFAGMGMKGKIEAAKQMQGAGGMAGVSGLPQLPGMGGRGSTKMKSPKDRYKKRKRR